MLARCRAQPAPCKRCRPHTPSARRCSGSFKVCAGMRPNSSELGGGSLPAGQRGGSGFVRARGRRRSRPAGRGCRRHRRCGGRAAPAAPARPPRGTSAGRPGGRCGRRWRRGGPGALSCCCRPRGAGRREAGREGGDWCPAGASGAGGRASWRRRGRGRAGAGAARGVTAQECQECGAAAAAAGPGDVGDATWDFFSLSSSFFLSCFFFFLF